MTRLIIGMTLALALCTLAACKYPYPGDVEDSDATAACTPSTTECTDDTLVVCGADGHVASQTACPFGCFASGDRCADLAPSNGLAPYLDQARTAQTIVLTEPARLDTDRAQMMTTANIPITTAVVPGQPVDTLV